MRIDDGPHPGAEHHRSELALRVSPTSNDIVAAWQEHFTQAVIRIYYTVSTDGRTFPAAPSPEHPTPAPVPLPSTCWNQVIGADPSVAFTRDGTAWVGYMGRGLPDPVSSYRPFDRVWITKKLPGAAAADVAWPQIVPSGIRIDKDIIAAGPLPGGFDDTLGVCFVAKPYATANAPWLPVAIPSPPEYHDFCTQPQYPAVYDMWHASDPEPRRAPQSALILKGVPGQVPHGRWIVGQYIVDVPGGVRVGSAHSDNGGQSWVLPSSDPTKARLADDDAQVENIAWGNPPGNPAYYFNSPILAADPTNPNNVYMVFTGRAESQTNQNNIDIFIAKSSDGGVNFSGTAGEGGDGFRVVRLTDHDLGDDLGPSAWAVQFHPSIAIDAWGGIHILYYAGWLVSGHWTYKVRLASIPSIDLQHHPSASTVDITTHSFTLEDPSMTPWIKEGRAFIGDYMNSLDVRGCQAIAGYIAQPPEGGPCGVFVSFAPISSVPCRCYANCDYSTVSPFLNINDFQCFLNKFAAEDEAANCDGSSLPPLLNVNDFQCFLNKFAAGCS